MIKKIFKLIFIIILLNTSYINSSLTLKLLWWNVHDFFDTIDDPVKDDKILSNEEYNKKLALVSEKIKSINPDIIGLGEIENINILKELSSETGYNYYYLEEGNDPRGIDVALLSKYKLEKYITNKNKIIPYDENPKYKFSRDVPIGVLNINNIKLYILITHLKSLVKDKNRSEKKKRAQVFGIFDIIEEIYQMEKNTYILIMGDFNSYRHTETLNLIEKSGLIILNYFYDERYFYTYKNKKDLDYFIINKNLKEKIKSYNLKVFNKKNFSKISDHFPLLLKIKF